VNEKSQGSKEETIFQREGGRGKERERETEREREREIRIHEKGKGQLKKMPKQKGDREKKEIVCSPNSSSLRRREKIQKQGKSGGPGN
jgi:hypothetical protein